MGGWRILTQPCACEWDWAWQSVSECREMTEGKLQSAEGGQRWEKSTEGHPDFRKEWEKEKQIW